MLLCRASVGKGVFMLSKEIKKNTVVLCWVIFLLLIFVHGFEAIFLNTDETFLGRTLLINYLVSL